MQSIPIVICLFQLQFFGTWGYSSGAPLSDEICTNLRPNHPGEPQTSKFPYTLKISQTTLPPKGRLALVIVATKKPFKGFLVQARKQAYDQDTLPRGSFKIDGNDEKHLQGLDCSNLENSSVTHKSGELKRNASITWEAPAEKGKYVMLVTVVESGKVYWVKHPTPVITVQ